MFGKHQGNCVSPKLITTVFAVWTSFIAPSAMAKNPAANIANEEAVPGDATVGEIIVTAQRREERLQDVPIAISAFDAEQLVTSGINSTIDLAVITPGLQFGTQAAYGQPFLRGVGTTGTGPGVESPVALYVDGVYYGSMIGSIVTFNNVDQVEVLKGPQGTLFGRNATGGLIQITTKDPSHSLQGTFSSGYGNYQTATGDLYLTGGLTRELAGDVAVHFQNQGRGFGTNLFTGTEVNKTFDFSIRSKWLWTPVERMSARLSIDYQHQDFRQAYVPAPGTVPPGDVPYTGDPQGLNGIFDPDGRIDQGGVSLLAKYDLGGIEVISTSAYRKSDVFVMFDGGLTRDPNSVLDLKINEKHTQFTQEFHLTSTGQGKLKWAAGFYFYDADARSDPLVITTLGAFGPAPNGINNIFVSSRQKTRSLAAYGQATAEILPMTNLTAGLRFTAERRKFAISQTLADFTGLQTQIPELTGNKTFKKLTWRLSLDHRLASNSMVYASYNRGFKAGGFNDYITPPQIYKPETLDAYEVGAKSEFFGRRFRANAALFYYNYNNIQAVEYPLGVEIIRNAARARLYGVDFDAEAVISPSLTVTAGFEYLHHRFTSFPDATIALPLAGGGTEFTRGDAKGNRLGLAPDFTLSVGLAYTLPPAIVPTHLGSISAYANWHHNDGFFAEPENRLRQSAYNVVNGRLVWALHDNLTKLILWGNNLTQAVYTVALASQDTGDFAIYAPPRTYGIKVERRF